MKVSDYMNLVEMKKKAHGMVHDFEDLGNIEESMKAKKLIDRIQNEMDAYPKVNVSFCIGYRSYYAQVTKIGKSYFHRGDKMTKSSGYNSIEEIDTITDKMVESMVADSYYY